MLPLCACGCGKPVTKPQNTYLRGHGRKRKKPLRIFDEAEPIFRQAYEAAKTLYVRSLQEREQVTRKIAYCKTLIETATVFGFFDDEPSITSQQAEAGKVLPRE